MIAKGLVFSLLLAMSCPTLCQDSLYVIPTKGLSNGIHLGQSHYKDVRKKLGRGSWKPVSVIRHVIYLNCHDEHGLCFYFSGRSLSQSKKGVLLHIHVNGDARVLRWTKKSVGDLTRQDIHENYGERTLDRYVAYDSIGVDVSYRDSGSLADSIDEIIFSIPQHLEYFRWHSGRGLPDRVELNKTTYDDLKDRYGRGRWEEKIVSLNGHVSPGMIESSSVWTLNYDEEGIRLYFEDDKKRSSSTIRRIELVGRGSRIAGDPAISPGRSTRGDVREVFGSGILDNGVLYYPGIIFLFETPNSVEPSDADVVKKVIIIPKNSE